MQIKILDKVFECDNQITAVEEIFKNVNQLLGDLDQRLSSFEIDGVEIFEDYGQYILDNIENIKIIIINVKSLNELLYDALESLQEYLSRAIPEIAIMVNEFQHGVTQNTWDKLAHLSDGLQYILNTLNAIQVQPALCNNAEQFVEVKNDLETQIAMLQEAVEIQDRVNIGDILLYEITSSLDKLNKEITVNIETRQVN